MSDNKEETVWEAFDRILAEHPDFKLPPNFPHPIPWRKPEEKPEHDSDVLVLTQDFSAVGCIASRYWGGLFCWDTSQPEWKALTPSEIVAWMYKRDLPLPDWVQK